eukprot:4772902-Amphidinium_carterae.5
MGYSVTLFLHAGDLQGAIAWLKACKRCAVGIAFSWLCKSCQAMKGSVFSCLSPSQCWNCHASDS